MTKPLTPLAFTRGLVKHLSEARITEAKIEKAKRFLKQRRELRNESTAKESAYEYVVEIALRPTITQYAENALIIPRSNSHRRIYSSHFHTASGGQREWKSRWTEFRLTHADVDTDDEGHSRRADLFISMGKTRLVSIEFKYLRPNRKPASQECVRQIRQHLTKHRACLLVLYAATPVSAWLETAESEIRNDLRSHNGFIVVKTGPPVEFH